MGSEAVLKPLLGMTSVRDWGAYRTTDRVCIIGPNILRWTRPCLTLKGPRQFDGFVRCEMHIFELSG